MSGTNENKTETFSQLNSGGKKWKRNEQAGISLWKSMLLSVVSLVGGSTDAVS